MVNLQDTPSAGPIRAIDLERDINTGRIYHLHRAWPCEWESCTGRACTDSARECLQAAPEGGKHAEPAPTKTSRELTGARVGFVVLLVSAVTVVGVIGAAVAARWPMAWPLG